MELDFDMFHTVIYVTIQALHDNFMYVTGPEGHPAYCKWLQCPGFGTGHPSQSSSKVKERVELLLYLAVCLHGGLIGCI